MTQAAVRRPERFFLGAACAGPRRDASPPEPPPPPLADPRWPHPRSPSCSCPGRSAVPRRSGARARAGPSRPGSAPDLRLRPRPRQPARPVRRRVRPRRSGDRAGAGPSGRDRSRDWEDSWRSDVYDVRPRVLVDARAPETAPVWAAGTNREPSQHSRALAVRGRHRPQAGSDAWGTTVTVEAASTASSTARPMRSPTCWASTRLIPTGN